MKVLFTEGADSTMKFIFEFYDFDKDGFISKEDIRTVLSYIPLNAQVKGDINFSDQAESQDELNATLDKCFNNSKLINYKQYATIVEEVSSDIYLFILMFLLKKRPFNTKTLEEYSRNKSFNEESSVSRTPKLSATCKMIASPSLNSKFLPSKQISASPMMRESRGFKTVKIENKSNLLMQLAGKGKVERSEQKKLSTFKNQASAEEEAELASKKIIRRNKKNLLKDIDGPQKELKEHEDMPLEPAFKQQKLSDKSM